MRKLMLILLFCFLISGCKQPATAPAVDSPQREKSGPVTEMPQSKKSLLRVELEEIKVIDGQERSTGTVKVSPFGPHKLLRERLNLRLYFSEAITQQDVEQALAFVPKRQFFVNRPQYLRDNSWSVFVEVYGSFVPGEQVNIIYAGREKNELEIALTRIADPEIVTLRCLTYPEKTSTPVNDSFTASKTYVIPSGRVTFEVEFSKAMNRGSVESVIRNQPIYVKDSIEQLGDVMRTAFEWENDRHLRFSLESEESQTVDIDLSGSLDTDGADLVAMETYSFMYSPWKQIYVYNVGSKEGKSEYTFQQIPTNVSLSPGKGFLIFQESAWLFNYKNYTDYLLDLQTLTVKTVGEPYKTFINTRPQSYRWSSDGNYFSSGRYIYKSDGEPVISLDDGVLGTVFSPDSKQAGVFYRQRDAGMYDTLFVLYEVPSGKQVSKYSSFTSYQFDLTYFPQPIYAYWIAAGQILYEDTVYQDEDAFTTQIAALDPVTGVKKVLIDNGNHLHVSPSGDDILVAIDEKSYLIHLPTMEKSKVLDSICIKAVWDVQERSIAITSLDDSIYIYDIQQKQLKPLQLTGELAGLDADGNLLIINAID